VLGHFGPVSVSTVAVCIGRKNIMANESGHVNDYRQNIFLYGKKRCMPPRFFFHGDGQNPTGDASPCAPVPDRMNRPHVGGGQFHAHARGGDNFTRTHVGDRGLSGRIPIGFDTVGRFD